MESPPRSFGRVLIPSLLGFVGMGLATIICCSFEDLSPKKKNWCLGWELPEQPGLVENSPVAGGLE